jgi:hypothetical protein
MLKSLSVTNVLPYSAPSTVAKKKSFLTLAPGLHEQVFSHIGTVLSMLKGVGLKEIVCPILCPIAELKTISDLYRKNKLT